MVRRSLLAAAGGLLLSGCGRASSGGDSASKTDRGTQIEGDIEVLSGLLELEQQAHAFYTGARGEHFAQIAAHEAEHVRRLDQALQELGGKPQPTAAAFANSDAPGVFAAKLENTLVAAYLDAIPKLADPKWRSLAAQIVAVEAEHLAVITGDADKAFVAGEREL